MLETLDFIETIEVYPLKSLYIQFTYEFMNRFESQRSKSLLDLCLRSFRFTLSNICCKAARPIEAKISCRTFMDWKKESLFKWSWSYDKDGRHAHIWKNWYTASGTWGTFNVCSADDPRLTLTSFTAKSTLLPSAFVWENA